MITAKLNTEKFLKDLAKIHGGMHQATARTINNMAEITMDRYNRLLDQEFEVRTNYTRKALKMYPATFERKSKPGELRALRDINALLFIRKQKGGKPHYLVIQEEGLAKTQHKSADDKVSNPIYETARSGGSIKGRVSPKYSLYSGGVRTLQIGRSAADFGVKGDRFSQAQRWAILNKYKTKNPYGWDLTKPFRVTYGNNTDAYALKGKSIMMVRSMRKTSMRVKKRPLFEQAFNSLTEQQAQQIFNTVAGRILS